MVGAEPAVYSIRNAPVMLRCMLALNISFFRTSINAFNTWSCCFLWIMVHRLQIAIFLAWKCYFSTNSLFSHIFLAKLTNSGIKSNLYIIHCSPLRIVSDLCGKIDLINIEFLVRVIYTGFYIVLAILSFLVCNVVCLVTFELQESLEWRICLPFHLLR